ncbi:MAG TPA: hypothetical protein VF173_01205 [Thermoanaerobaculia bacterium]|nr:hypothetical protein [Thermoanaerobaculia bacterium]
MRKLLMLVGMLGICACSLLVQPTLAASFPTCGPSYCPSHPDAACQCPPGSRRYPTGVAPCDTWHADCNFL